MKQLSNWKLCKYNEVEYIKRFIDGVTQKELEKMFRKRLLQGFYSILLGTKLINKNGEIIAEVGKKK